MENFETVYTTYFRDVELYLLALCKRPDLAEELAAQTFFKAMDALPSFRGQCDIRSWLCTIARNQYISHLRKTRPSVPVESLAISDPAADVEERICDRTQAMAVHKALHDLQEPYKEVFSLRVFGQLSFEDIGTLFGKTANWACVTYHRAKKKIMDVMEVRDENKL